MSANGRPRVRCALLLIALVAAPSCETLGKTPEARRDLIPHHGGLTTRRPPRRVVLLPLATEVGHEAYARDLGQALREAIGRRALLEIVPIDDGDLADAQIDLTRSRGTYRTQDLVLVSRRFGADGILFGTLTSYRPYPSVAVGLRLDLLDCRTGEAPFSTDLVLDSEDLRVVQDVHNWHDTQRRDPDSLWAHDRTLVSPRLFAAYLSDRVTETLAATFAGPSADD